MNAFWVQNQRSRPLRLQIEPWADGIDLPPGQTACVVGECPGRCDESPEVLVGTDEVTLCYGAGYRVRVFFQGQEVIDFGQSVPEDLPIVRRRGSGEHLVVLTD